MNILADASLPELQACFPPPFRLTLYESQSDIPELLHHQDILFCRSTLKVNQTLLQDHSIKIVATASSGVDHIDEHFLSSREILLFDAKGSNASSVADYVLACLAFLQKKHDFKGRTAGIAGLGAVGKKVAVALKPCGFEILWYDPYLKGSPQSGRCPHIEDILQADLICLHPNLHDNAPCPSRDLLNVKELSLIKSGSAIINASRGGVVNEKALLKKIWPFFYCSDVFLNEPNVDSKIIEMATLTTPHIAGHTLEAKLRAVTQVSEALHQHFGWKIPEFPVILRGDSTDIQYHPERESILLKQAEDKKAAFLRLRKAHIRHAVGSI